MIYQTQGDLDQAAEMFRKALAFNEELGRKEGVALNYGNLGMIYKARGDRAKARECLGKAIDLFKEVGMKPELEKVEGWLAALSEEAETP